MEKLALTDHDELGGVGEARSAAEDAGIGFVCGVEISVSWCGHTLHVVGLHIDPDNHELVDGLTRIRDGRLRRAETIAAGLEEAGIDASLQGARAYVTNPRLIGRTHFARFLVGRGHARDVQAVFRKYLAPGKPGYAPHQWATLEQAVSWIRVSGGTAVLAHPGRYKLDTEQRQSLLEDFTELGGGAIEVVTSSHTREQHAFWGSCARRYGLSASIGSDFHGPLESSRDLGSLEDLPGGCTPVWKAW